MFRILHNASSNRIELDVISACENILVGIQEQAFVSPLPQMTYKFVFFAIISRVKILEAMHEQRELIIFWLQGEMNMIRHEHEMIQKDAVTRLCFSN